MGDGLVGALDSQSLGPGSMLGTEVCLFILSSSPESPKPIIINSIICTCINLNVAYFQALSPRGVLALTAQQKSD